MNEMKEIQLINKLPTSEEIAEIELALEDGDSVLIIPPKPKTVKLSELPDGTVIEVNNTFHAFVSKDDICLIKTPHAYRDVYAGYIAAMEIIESPKQVWEGGECPVSDGVVVRVCYRAGEYDSGTSDCFNWGHDIEDSDSDIIWYQIISLAENWKLVK